MLNRIVRVLRNKRFWCWLLKPCFFLGHDVKEAPLLKGFRNVSGEWFVGGQTYCARCSSAEPENSEYSNWWYGNLFRRTIGLSWSATKNLYFFRYWWPVKMFLFNRKIRIQQTPRIRQFVKQHPAGGLTECSLYMGSYITQEDLDRVRKEALGHNFRGKR